MMGVSFFVSMSINPWFVSVGCDNLKKVTGFEYFYPTQNDKRMDLELNFG